MNQERRFNAVERFSEQKSMDRSPLLAPSIPVRSDNRFQITSAIPMQHRFVPTKSWTVPQFHVTVTYRSSHFHLGAVVFNTRKQPATDNNVATLQLSTPGQFERLLDSDEAAALLGIHKKTLQRMARSGEVPGVQIGDLWRFRASTLNEWLTSRLAG